MKSFIQYCCVAALLVGNLQAADIDWGPVFEITGTEVIFVPDGQDTPVEAVNATNSGIIHELDTDAGITIPFLSVGALDDPDFPGLPILASTTGDAQFTPPKPDLDETFLTILGSHTWQGGGGEFNLGDVTPNGEQRTVLIDAGGGQIVASPAFEPLVEGNEYVVQILGVFDGRDCCAERDTLWGDGRGADFASEPLTRGVGHTIIGNFIADDTTQLLQALPGEGGGGTDPGLSAYILWDVTDTGNPGIACDFNADTQCNVADIDLLMSEVGGGTNNVAFDMNSDGVVTDADRDVWLSTAATQNGLSAPYDLGDTNLDLRVNAQDLNSLGVSWQSAKNNYSEGNLSGAGVDAADLNDLGLNWQKVHPDAPLGAAAAVPEPAGAVLLLFGLLGLATMRRR